MNKLPPPPSRPSKAPYWAYLMVAPFNFGNAVMYAIDARWGFAITWFIAGVCWLVSARIMLAAYRIQMTTYHSMLATRANLIAADRERARWLN